VGVYPPLFIFKMAAYQLSDLELKKFEESESYPKSTVRVTLAGSGGNTVYTVPPNTETVSLTGNKTDEIILTPGSGNQLQIIAVLMTSDASLFTATLEFPTSGIVVQEHFEQGTLGSYIPCNITGAVDESLTFSVDNSADKNWFIIVNYAEVTP
jgi:hypothetical protein